MKILQVVNAFKPSWEYGGPARIAYEVSKVLEERGHDVTAYTTDGRAARLNVKKNSPVSVDGITTYYFRNLSLLMARHMNIFFPYYMPFVARREIKTFDVIHIHEHRSALAIITRHYAKKYNVPYVMQTHGSAIPHFKKILLKKIFDRLFGYRIFREATKVIALTDFEAEEYLAMGVAREKIAIIPNGMNLAECDDIKQGRFRAAYKISENKKVILFLGRLHEIKGIELLIDAFHELLPEFDDILLVLAGPDNGFLPAVKKKIESAKIEDKILLTGQLENPLKMQALADADIFVLPSKYEAFPVVVLEACACNTPVIVTRKTNVGKLIEGKAGIVIDYDREQLKSAIRVLLTDDGLRDRYSAAGMMLVKENFEMGFIVRKIESLYMTVLRNDGAGPK